MKKNDMIEIKTKLELLNKKIDKLLYIVIIFISFIVIGLIVLIIKIN